MKTVPAPYKAHRILRYSAPAGTFNEALPIGNGRLGAMVYGGVARDRLSLNDDRLWAGIEAPKPVANGPAILAEARRLFRSASRKAAQNLLEAEFTTDFNQPYLPAGNLILDWDRAGTVEAYERSLDLDDAIARTRFRQGNASFESEVFATSHRQVIVAAFQQKEAVLPPLHVALESPLLNSVTVEDGDLVLRGRAPSRVRWHGVDDAVTDANRVTYDPHLSRHFAARVRIAATDGAVRAGDGGLHVEGAHRIVVMIATATDARGDDPAGMARQDIDRASAEPFEELRSQHIREHRRLFHKFTLKLDGPERSHISPDQRLRDSHDGAFDPGLLTLMHEYGRYMMIASSRPGSLPINLSGIWSERVDPAWWSNYTLNINVQMCYWPAAACGLLECAEPLYDFIAALSKPGAETARIMYGARGWVANHQSDNLLQTTPVGRLDHRTYEECAKWALWPFGGAWLCLHLFEHYAYTLDKAFLARAYPLMKGAALFMLDWLVTDPDNPALLATIPSTSPENTYRDLNGDVCAVARSSTMDIAIIRALFGAVQRAADILALDDAGFRAEIAEALPRLPEPRISRDGRILEFDGDFQEAEHPHRHISHLFDLCPNNRITPEGTPKWAEAARRALAYRSDVIGTGWTFAWKARCYARLKDAGKSLAMIKLLMAPLPNDVFAIAFDGGGTLPNLFSACPPFCIEANLGLLAAVNEMIVQDHTDVIHLLPALPPELASGEVTGFNLRGAMQLSLRWQEGRVVAMTVTAPAEGEKSFRIGSITRSIRLRAGENVLNDVLSGFYG